MSLSLALYIWSLLLYNLVSSQAVSLGSFSFGLISENVNWTDARLRCNAFGLELASVHSYDEGVEVMNLCGVTNDTGCWIAGNETYLSRYDSRYYINSVMGFALPAICGAPTRPEPTPTLSETASKQPVPTSFQPLSFQLQNAIQLIPGLQSFSTAQLPYLDGFYTMWTLNLSVPSLPSWNLYYTQGWSIPIFRPSPPPWWYPTKQHKTQPSPPPTRKPLCPPFCGKYF